jgi:WhiB family redox-sensing transcriptional regulator
MRPDGHVGNWLELAACRGLPAALFFLDDEDDAGPAKLICAGCVVRQSCLDAALRNREPAGIWGGLTPYERKQVLRRRRRQAQGLTA